MRRVAPDGTITTVAGGGQTAADGIPATRAQLFFPFDVAVTPDGGYLIADVDSHRVRKVSADGTITTVAGSGAAGFNGDGGPTRARLNKPGGVSVTPDGGLFIADTSNQRIRRVAPDGTISTVAGTGVAGFGGDGGRAVDAQLNAPNRVAAVSGRGFVAADSNNHRIRAVDVDGTITTSAGTGSAGFSGEGGPASAAQLNRPFGLAATAAGNILIADTFNNRIRRSGPLRSPTPTPTATA